MFCKFSFSRCGGSSEEHSIYTGSLRAKLIKHLFACQKAGLGLTLNEMHQYGKFFIQICKTSTPSIASEHAPKTHYWNPMDSMSYSLVNLICDTLSCFHVYKVSFLWETLLCSMSWHYRSQNALMTNLPNMKRIVYMQNNHLGPTKSTLVELTDNMSRITSIWVLDNLSCIGEKLLSRIAEMSKYVIPLAVVVD